MSHTLQPPAVERPPWERQPNESAKAFAAFGVYLDQGSARSYRAVARQLKKARSHIEAWAARWHWRERALAWEDEQERVKRRAQTEALESMIERHAQQAQAALQALTAPVAEVLTRVREARERGEEPFEGTETDELIKVAIACARAIPAVVLSERLSRGATTENVEQRGSEGHPVRVETTDGAADALDNLSVDELRQLRDLFRKMSGAGEDS